MLQEKLYGLATFVTGILFGLLVMWLLGPSAPVPETQAPAPTPPPVPATVEDFNLSPVEWPALTGWTGDDHTKALATFRASCAALLKMPAGKKMDGAAFAGTVGDWQPVCELANFVGAADGAARQFFEEAFVPHAVAMGEDTSGLFTGYYVPVLPGRLQQQDGFGVPLMSRPDDLVSVNLGTFEPELSGRQIYGRVKDGKLAPYYSRADIEQGNWPGASLPLVWLEDPVEAFFLHIQGSGIIQLEDGRKLRMGFDGKNGHPYTSVGRYLIRENMLGPHEASAQGIKMWFAANPDKGPGVLRRNASYVFFHRQDSVGAIGALNVPLTARRSLAVDRRFMPLGAPLWLELDGDANQDISSRLMVAQDTGGAIKGAVRGDFYWGEGDEAGSRAGRMKQDGRYFILLPVALAESLDL